MEVNNEYEKQKKKVTILIVLVAVLGVALIGITYAFFSYVRTGEANTIRVGNITFNSEQTTITLSDVYPITFEEAKTDTTNSDTITINVNGKTSYAKGLEYRVSLVQVKNWVESGKEIPVAYNVTADGVGTISSDYYTERGGNESIYFMTPNGQVTEGKNVMVGYISPGDTGISGTINIKAYLDANNLSISDTYDGTESDQMGTTNSWVGNRTVITTKEWNSLSDNPVSFKIRVEAQEGIWVDDTPVAPKLSCGLVAYNQDGDFSGKYTYYCNVNSNDYEIVNNDNDYISSYKYEIYERNNSNYTVVYEGEYYEFDIDQVVTLYIEAGTSKNLSARAYIVNNDGEKVYSDYSEEVTIDWATYDAPVIGIMGEAIGYRPSEYDREHLVYKEEKNAFLVSLEGYHSSYNVQSSQEPTEYISVISGYDFHDENETLVYESNFYGVAEVYVSEGSKKTFTAKAYAKNSSGNKIYSPASNEFSIDLTNPTYTFKTVNSILDTNKLTIIAFINDYELRLSGVKINGVSYSRKDYGVENVMEIELDKSLVENVNEITFILGENKEVTATRK